MYTQNVTITTSVEFSSTEELTAAGGSMLAADERFDDRYYHYYLINNNLVGEKTINSPTSMTIVRTDINEDQKIVLEQMYQSAKAVYLDNGWDANWTFE